MLGVLAVQAGRQGRVDEVVEYSDRAAALDPLGAIWPGNKAGWLIRFRRADEAEVALRKAYELNGRTRSLHEGMADIHNIRGEYDAALEALSHVPNEEFNLTRRAIALYGAGQVEEADGMLAMFEQVGIPEAIFGIAQAHAMRGNNDLAFETLEKVSGDLSPVNLVYDAYARALTDDPRWKPWVDSLDWPWDYEY